MKVASKVVFLFKEPSGLAESISGALHPNPTSSLRRLEDSFNFSLDRYGISDCKASGNIVHFADVGGAYQVTILLLREYEPPVLACAVNEVLEQITREASSTMPTLFAPFIVTSSKLKLESMPLRTHNGKATLWGIQIGSETDITRTLIAKTKKPPLSLQIYYEPLACFLHVVQIMKLSTFFLIGKASQNISGEALGQELEILCEMGELLASSFSLSFLRGKVMYNPQMITREKEEPWRALYG